MRQKHNRRLLHYTQNKESAVKKEIFKTLSYSDIFDYPLTGDQLFRFLGMKIAGKDFLSAIQKVPHKIVGKTIYYFLPKREKIVLERIEKEKISVKKMQKLIQIINIFRFIPSILFIGVSGSLALMNADKKSDSDIFIITRKNMVWLTRLIVYILLYSLSLKRKKGNESYAICANMFLAESSMHFSKDQQNMYNAHEIMQLVSLYNKDKTYERFVGVNKWITSFFPNTVFSKIDRNDKHISQWNFFIPLEYILRVAQIWYMNKKQTRETVTAEKIAFHPIDYETLILNAYKKNEKRYGL